MDKTTRRTTKFGRPGTAGGRAYNLAVLCGLFDERKVAEEAHAEAKEEEEDDEGQGQVILATAGGWFD